MHVFDGKGAAVGSWRFAAGTYKLRVRVRSVDRRSNAPQTPHRGSITATGLSANVALRFVRSPHWVLSDAVPRTFSPLIIATTDSLNMTDNYPVPPPRYSESRIQTEEASSPLLGREEGGDNGSRQQEAPVEPGEGGRPRNEGDHVHDDFKYADKVADCTMPIRQAFIRKVYSILTVQLLVTVATGAIITTNPDIRNWALSHIWTFYVSLFGAMGFMIGAFIKQRSYPTNLIFLTGFTLLESYAVGTVSSLYDTKIVIQAAALTFIIFAGVSLFAIQTKYDLTGWAGYLNMALWGLIGFGLVAIFFPFSSKIEILYSSIGALVFTGYILVDTQMIMKKLHPEDEIAAAVSLYLDIINLFLNILRILNEIQNDN